MLAPCENFIKDIQLLWYMEEEIQERSKSRYGCGETQAPLCRFEKSYLPACLNGGSVQMIGEPVWPQGGAGRKSAVRHFCTASSFSL